MRYEYTVSDEEKAREIIGGDCKKENCLECGGKYSAEEGGCVAYQRIMQMAEWKNKQFEDYLNSVLYIKMLYFLNEKEKRENTIIDKMDWRETAKEFANYLKQQEENSETC